MKTRSIVLTMSAVLLTGWALYSRKMRSWLAHRSASDVARNARQKKLAADNAIANAIRTDADALSALSVVNAHEIANAEIAELKNASEPLLRYASMLRAEHAENQRLTLQLARVAGLSITALNPKVAELHSISKTERDCLYAIEHDQFDDAFLDATIKGHVGTISMIDNELLPSVARAEVDRHLRETRAHFEAHLAKARTLKEQRSVA